VNNRDQLNTLPTQQRNKERFELAKSFADKGARSAQFALGQMYALGLDGVHKNPCQAAYCYRKSLSRQVISLSFLVRDSVYTMAANSFYLCKDLKMAIRYYQLSAYYDTSSSAHKLAEIYYKGVGVPANYMKAYAWATFYKAKQTSAANLSTGEQEANNKLLTELGNKLSQDDIVHAQALAETYFSGKFIYLIGDQ